MTKELKTLKDIQKFEDLKHSEHFIVSSNVLKQEAIKWVKEYQRLGRSYRSRIIFIQHFFNITEDDLK